MSLNQFSRTELLIGKDGIEKLKNAKVAIFGIGGVGSYTVEGKHAGFYARISKTNRIDSNAQDIPVIIERSKK